MITTVNGEIREDQLGITSSHEHIFIDMRGCVDVTGNEPECFYQSVSFDNRGEVLGDPYAILDNALLEGIDDAVAEVEQFKKWGGQSMIDCTLDEIGRDPVALREVSRRTGVNIIMGCGHYYHKAHYPYVKSATVETLADEMIRDIRVGVGETGIRAGVIGEIGTSAIISEDEKKVLRAAGMAGAETGKAIHVHTDLYTQNGFEVLDILTAEGVSPELICIDHVDVLPKPDYIRALMDKGAYVEFDDFGKEFYLSEERRFIYDLERIRLLKQLIDEGYGKQILICNDICLKTMWKKYGGPGYAHILRLVKHMALENGIDEKTYNSLLTENVKNFLTGGRK
ncbi:MAG: TatD family hydrolase [Lachnospiraceae bacterium]|nr:TatD family hydrolase [Lachnospiraceae bacterium]